VHRVLATLVTLALALTPTIANISPQAEAAPRPLRRLSIQISSDRTSVQVGDVITYTLRATNTGRRTIAAYNLLMDPPANLAPVSVACGRVPDQPNVPTPDGLWCEYGCGEELAPGASVTMTLGAQLTLGWDDTAPVVAMVGCAAIAPQVGGSTFSCAASALDGAHPAINSL
jgi:uncharacterized repeat protein (TIGR01451 family)